MIVNLRVPLLDLSLDFSRKLLLLRLFSLPKADSVHYLFGYLPKFSLQRLTFRSGVQSRDCRWLGTERRLCSVAFDDSPTAQILSVIGATAR